MITLSPKIFSKDCGLCEKKEAHAQEHEKKKRKNKET
jgi:hypothetical protein